MKNRGSESSGNSSKVTQLVSDPGQVPTCGSFRDLLSFAWGLVGWWVTCRSWEGAWGPSSPSLCCRVWGSHVLFHPSWTLLHRKGWGPGRRKDESKDNKVTQRQKQDRAFGLTSGPPKGRILTDKGWGVLGKPAWDPLIFLTFLHPYCVPRLQVLFLLRTSQLLYVFICPAAGAARAFHSSYRWTQAGQGPAGPRDSLQRPEHPPPVGNCTGQFKRGVGGGGGEDWEGWNISMCLNFSISRKGVCVNL